VRNAESVVRYWRKSLSDESYAHVVIGEGTHDGFLLADGTAGQWKVATEILSGIGHPEGGSYLLGIGALSRVTGREGMRSIIPMLLIPVEVNRQGEIAPDFAAGGPWLQRALFFQPFRFANSEEVEWKVSTYPLLGEAGDKAVQDLPWEHRWQVAMPMVDKLLRVISAGSNGWSKDNGISFVSDMTGRIPEGWVVDRAVFFLPMQASEINRTRMTGPLLASYDHLTERMLNGRPPKVLHQFASIDPERPKQPIDQKDRVAAVQAHLGQVGDQYPMDPDQRRAAQTAAVMEEGGILAVEGPPGTGKTSLIQALVADVVIAATLRNPEVPGKVLISSANNQAIENVLEAFAKTGGHRAENAILTQRWLPEIGSIGLHLAAYSRVSDEASLWKWPTYYPGRDAVTSLSILRDEHLSGAAWNTFRMFYAKQYGDKPEDAESAARDLLLRVRDTAKQLQERIKSIRSHQNLLDQAWHLHDQSGYDLGVVERWKGQLAKAKETYDAILSEENTTMHRLKLAIPGQKKKYEEEKEKRLREAGIPVPMEEAMNWMTALAKRIKEAAKLSADLRPHLRGGNSLADLGRDATAWPESIALDMECDTTVRVELFWTAIHYWEAKWIAEMSKRHVNTKGQIPAWDYAADNAATLEGWNLRYMVFPVMISTLYSAPRFFANKDKEPLVELLDLVILDEAGQASPELAGPTVALGKKLVVLGDEAQMEPIWGVEEEVDKENIAHAQIAPVSDYEDLKAVGLTAYGTSVQARAYATDNTGHLRMLANGKVAGAGLSLTHHRRSCEPIMQIYNKLSYQGRLRCERKPNEKALQAGLHPLQYQHVPSFSRKQGESRENPTEARMVALWISRWKPKLLELYEEDDLSHLVGVVTPYASQAVLIRKAVRDLGIADDITIGTIHKLQGAERAVVIVSPTVGYGDSMAFFDGASNMINVATSRAQDALVLIGNLDMTPSAPTTYSRTVAQMVANGERLRLPTVAIDTSWLLSEGLNDAEYCPGAKVVGQIQEMIVGISANRIQIVLSGPEDIAAWAKGTVLHQAVEGAMEKHKAKVMIVGRPDWDLKERITFSHPEQVNYQLSYSPFTGARITAASEKFTCMAAGDSWIMSDHPWIFFCGAKVRKCWSGVPMEGEGASN